MNKEYVCDFAKKLLQIDSPTGYTKSNCLCRRRSKTLKDMKQNANKQRQFMDLCKWKSKGKTNWVMCHCDTLGLMVRSIKSDGKLALTN